MTDVGGGKFLLEVYDLSGQALDPAEVAELRRGLAGNGRSRRSRLTRPG
ncbi:MAG TPA: hypothetical protein VFC19_25020 [Candidatus Limnocylindrales bacterium]|nr:hypothetical protein [Candidatus Limnocylindrales bacterium]